jgi:penicillin-binding protein 2
MFKSSDLQTHTESLRSLKRRSKFIFFFLFLLSFAGISQIFNLTLIKQANYVTESEKNRIVTIPIYPSRGLIKSAKDESLIAENIVSQKLTISIDGNSNMLGILEEMVQIIGIPNKDINNFINIISRDGFKKKSVTLIDDLSESQIAKFLLHKERWPSVKITPHLKRFVVDGSLFSHAIGYLGPVSLVEKQDSENFRYRHDAETGKTGLEKFYENELRGFAGYRTVEVDVYGNEVRELERAIPIKAKDIYISLDRDLQSMSIKMLNGRKGAVVALDPTTGLIKTLVSSPDYDPNLFNDTSEGSVSELINNPDSPFFNRAISGNYPPASTLKPFIGLLGLDSKIIDSKTTIEDKGFYQVNGEGRRYRGWKEDGHGIVNLKKAIVESSDVYFYELASKLTIDNINKFLKNFGFGKQTSINLDGETSGVLPSRNWKMGSIGESWYVGDTVNLGIGQGYISASPIQLAMAVSALATKGVVYRPSLVERVDDQKLSRHVLFNVELEDKSNWKKIEESMVGVISAWNGTAHNIHNTNGIVFAGKTGTAQIKSLTEEDLTVQEEYEDVRKDIKNRDHAIFVSYGPIPNPNLVVVVIVENGESGSAVAAPIAKSLFDLYQKLNKEDA